MNCHHNQTGKWLSKVQTNSSTYVQISGKGFTGTFRLMHPYYPGPRYYPPSSDTLLPRLQGALGQGLCGAQGEGGGHAQEGQEGRGGVAQVRLERYYIVEENLTGQPRPDATPPLS